MQKIYSTEDIKDIATRAGSKWFSPDNMRFFNSRVGIDAYPDTTCTDHEGYYFITSEKYDYKSPRLYTVRYWCIDSPTNIVTVGNFQQHTTRARALGHIKRLLKGDPK